MCCRLTYILGGLILLLPYGFGNNEPHQVYVQVNAHDPWVCGPEPTDALCPHKWVTVKLCDELSRSTTFSKGSEIKCGIEGHRENRIDKEIGS